MVEATKIDKPKWYKSFYRLLNVNCKIVLSILQDHFELIALFDESSLIFVGGCGESMQDIISSSNKFLKF